MAFRICKTCIKAFPATSEYFDSVGRIKDGSRCLLYKCRSCRREYARIYRQENHQRVLEWKRADWFKHHEKNLRRLADRRPQHKKRHRETANSWYEDNRALTIKRARQWAKDNPEQNKLLCRVKEARRRARIRDSKGNHTRLDIERQLNGQKHRCWWCNRSLKKINWHVDHREPIALGGSNGPENIVIACAPCNSSKNAKTPQEWAGRLL